MTYFKRFGNDPRLGLYAELESGGYVPLFLIDYAGNVGECRFFNDGRHVPAPNYFFMFAITGEKEPEWVCLKCLSRFYIEANLRQMWRQQPTPDQPPTTGKEPA